MQACVVRYDIMEDGINLESILLTTLDRLGSGILSILTRRSQARCTDHAPD